jgi:hypothetical protein
MGCYSRLFLVPMKGGDLITPSDRFKQPKSIYLKRTFSDGKHSVSQTTPESKRPYGQTGRQGCFPNSGHSRGLSIIPLVYMEWPNISISSPAIRVVHGPKNIHESSQTCYSVPSYAEQAAPHLSGRYSNCRFRYRAFESFWDFRASEKPELYYKFREVRLNPSQVMEFLGLKPVACVYSRLLYLNLQLEYRPDKWWAECSAYEGTL